MQKIELDSGTYYENKGKYSLKKYLLVLTYY